MIREIENLRMGSGLTVFDERLSLEDLYQVREKNNLLLAKIRDLNEYVVKLEAKNLSLEKEGKFAAERVR